MRDWYEDLWRELPEQREPFELAARRALLLAHARPGRRVLDLGCGDGAFSAIARAAGAEVVGVDIAEAALERARARVPGGDFRRAEPDGALPLDDADFDVVWASEVLEHVADTARLLSEVRRVLRSGGRLAVTTPHHGRLRTAAVALVAFERHFDPLGQHLRFYTRRSLRAVLEDFGFDRVEVRGLGGRALLPAMLAGEGRRGSWRRG